MNKAYLEACEVQKLEQAATNMRDKLLIRILFHLGCRISEALSLGVYDIDFTQGTVRIQHLKTRLKLTCRACGAGLGRKHTFCPRCGQKVDEAQVMQQDYHRQRILPLDNHTLTMLKEYIERGGPFGKSEGKLIFGINRHRAWQIVRDCARKAGLPMLINTETGRRHNVSPHRLRDAFATHAVKLDDSGDGLRLLQEHLGHVSFNTTAKYRKVSGKEQKEWYEKLWKEEVKTNGS